MSVKVPFGKYKGRSIARMAADVTYLCQIIGQPTMHQRFPKVLDRAVACYIAQHTISKRGRRRNTAVRAAR